ARHGEVLPKPARECVGTGGGVIRFRLGEVRRKQPAAFQCFDQVGGHGVPSPRTQRGVVVKGLTASIAQAMIVCGPNRSGELVEAVFPLRWAWVNVSMRTDAGSLR